MEQVARLPLSVASKRLDDQARDGLDDEQQPSLRLTLRSLSTPSSGLPAGVPLLS
jgi:hypothetical protein